MAGEAIVNPDKTRPADTVQETAVTARLFDESRIDLIRDDWRHLETQSRPNPFFSEHYLSSALRHLNQRDKAQLLCLYDDEELIGLFPVRYARGFSHTPFRYLEAWTHPFCFYTEPLIKRDAEALFLDGLVKNLTNLPGGPAFVSFPLIDADKNFTKKARPIGSYHWHETQTLERAMLYGGYNAEHYLTETIRKKKRKELSRLRNRLQELGEITFDTWTPEHNIRQWIDQFLQLEDSGWKGENKTSFAQNDDHTSFLKDTIQASANANTLRFHRLCVGDKTIAMIVNFYEDGQGYSFKICYDENYARYSPGVMLEIEMIKWLAHQETFSFYDSCAARNHPMINSLWRDRRKMTMLNIASNTIYGRSVLHFCAMLEKMGRFSRSILPHSETS